MNSKSMQEIRTVIKGRLQELSEILGNSEGKDILEEVAGESNMEKNINTAIDSSVIKNAEKEIVQLKRNLQWLDTEDGGYCEICGEEIPFARLKVLPHTRLCVNCAEKI